MSSTAPYYSCSPKTSKTNGFHRIINNFNQTWSCPGRRWLGNGPSDGSLFSQGIPGRVSTPWEKDDGYLWGRLSEPCDYWMMEVRSCRGLSSFFTVGCCSSIWLTMHKPSHPSVWSHLTSAVRWYLKEGIQIIEFRWIWQHWKCHRYTFRRANHAPAKEKRSGKVLQDTMKVVVGCFI